MPPELPHENVLVIKLGAFGNIVLALGAFRAIRQHHPGAKISVLTSAAYADWLRSFPYFDEVLVDPNPTRLDFAGRGRLREMFARGQFNRVYDLQTAPRSSRYFTMFPTKHRPAWSGIAYGCALPDRNPDRNRMHDVARLESQLRQAGLTEFPPADLSWCTGDIARFNLPQHFAILVPGSSPTRLAKRWPAIRYAALAELLAQRGIGSVVVGSAQEAGLAAQIPKAIDLTGQTGFGDLADLARAARFAVGNDTGPMHLIATAGCPTVTLFSRDSNPDLCAPAGPWTRVLRRPDLADLSVEDVLAALPETACAA